MQAQPDQELAPASHSIGLAPAPLSLSTTTNTTIVVDVVVVFAYISRLKSASNKQTNNMSQMFEEQKTENKKENAK